MNRFPFDLNIQEFEQRTPILPTSKIEPRQFCYSLSRERTFIDTTRLILWKRQCLPDLDLRSLTCAGLHYDWRRGRGVVDLAIKPFFELIQLNSHQRTLLYEKKSEREMSGGFTKLARAAYILDGLRCFARNPCLQFHVHIIGSATLHIH